MLSKAVRGRSQVTRRASVTRCPHISEQSQSPGKSWASSRVPGGDPQGRGVRGGASQRHQVLGDATAGTAHGLEPELLGPLVLALLAQLSHYTDFVVLHQLPAPPFPVSESYLKGRPVRGNNYKPRSMPSQIRSRIGSTLVCLILVFFFGAFLYLDTRTTSDALKASYFRTITDRNIPAIKVSQRFLG